MKRVLLLAVLAFTLPTRAEAEPPGQYIELQRTTWKVQLEPVFEEYAEVVALTPDRWDFILSEASLLKKELTLLRERTDETKILVDSLRTQVVEHEKKDALQEAYEVQLKQDYERLAKAALKHPRMRRFWLWIDLVAAAIVVYVGGDAFDAW